MNPAPAATQEEIHLPEGYSVREVSCEPSTLMGQSILNIPQPDKVVVRWLPALVTMTVSG